MTYDFDQEIDRQGTCAVKWEISPDFDGFMTPTLSTQCFGPDRLLPLWVADMDFSCPQPVVDALVDRAKHGLYGYTAPFRSYFESVVGWMRERHGWEIDPSWIALTPGVVTALSVLVRTFISPGDKVLVQPPVYHPFFDVVENNGAVIARNALLYEGGRYQMDFADLEAQAQDPGVKAAILCSPHNPVGRVWSRQELIRFAEICLQNDVLIISDEIHGDLILPGHRFTPLGAISRELAEASIICTAASKTFNLAGLKTSNIVIANPELRERFQMALAHTGLYGANPFGLVATETAYRQGESWLEQVLAYIQGNWQFLQDFLARHLPQVTVAPLEGTYLAWLDCRGLSLDPEVLNRLLLDDARVWLSPGSTYGQEGRDFQRLNIACPRPILVEALERMKSAIDRHGVA